MGIEEQKYYKTNRLKASNDRTKPKRPMKGIEILSLN